MKITLLEPQDRDYSIVTKSFLRIKGNVELKDNYRLGKLFKHKILDCPDIQKWYELLVKCADRRVFRIYGIPKTGIPKVVQRKKIFFDDVPTQLLEFDIDGWDVPEGFEIRTRDGIRRTIRHLLIDELGMAFLDQVSFVVMFSASHWSYARVKAHVYFMIDAPIEVQKLHSFAMCQKTLASAYALDPAVYRIVQPDFIAKRICIDFKDPLPPNVRLSLFDDEDFFPAINLAELDEYIDLTFQQAQSLVPSGSTTGVVKSIQETWEKTLELCGTPQHGINEPAYLACAQLVGELGSDAIKHNLNHYVDKVHRLLWSHIAAHGARNTKEDRQKYDRAKIRNYLTTAIDKRFGVEVDLHFQTVVDAINKVKLGQAASLLFDTDILDSFRYLKANQQGKWSIIRAKIKNELRGTITISEIEKALSGSGTPQDLANRIKRLLNQFKWVEGTIDKGLYCKVHNSANYTMVPIDEGVENDLFAKALEIDTEALPQNFIKNAMSILVAEGRSMKTTRFAKAPVENRCFSTLTDGGIKTYLNLGRQSDGDMKTACITHEPPYIRIIHSNDAPIMWRTASNILPIPVNDISDSVLAYGEDFRNEAGRRYLKLQRQYTRTQDLYGFIDLVAWQVASLIHLGISSILELTGPSESGKSTTALLTKEIFDPTSDDLREAGDLHNRIYKSEDLARILRRRHVTILDNLSHLTMAEQNEHCLISTGWKLDLRILYTSQFMPIVVKRPVIITCLSPVVTNQDLRTRSVSVSIGGKNVVKGDIFEQWEKDRPEMIIGLMSIVSKTLERINYMRSRNVDLNKRDLWLNVARKEIMLMLGCFTRDRPSRRVQERRIDDFIKQQKDDRDIEEALVNSVSSLVCAWVLRSDMFGPDIDVFWASVSDLYVDFRQWVNENAGSVVKVHGATIEVLPVHLPKNPRSLGHMLSKHLNDIQKVTGWNFIRGGRSKGTRGYRIMRGHLTTN